MSLYSSNSPAFSIVSGELASGAVTPIALGKSAFPATALFTGNFSWSGVSAGTSGVAIASGSYTPTSTGKLWITAFAALQSVAGGPTLANTANMGIVSGTGIAVSGLGIPPVSEVTMTGAVSGAINSISFSQSVLVSGAVLNSAVNYALIMAPLASGLMSGTGSLYIQELIA